MIEGLISAIPVLHKLNRGLGKNSDRYPALKTRIRTVSTWWDSLDYNGRVGVGNYVLHIGQLTANSRWWKCADGDHWNTLSKKQQVAIRRAFEERSRKYQMFDMRQLFKV
jgi:hypothetical protein